MMGKWFILNCPLVHKGKVFLVDLVSNYWWFHCHSGVVLWIASLLVNQEVEGSYPARSKFWQLPGLTKFTNIDEINISCITYKLVCHHESVVLWLASSPC
jgi:hypothetical protein